MAISKAAYPVQVMNEGMSATFPHQNSIATVCLSGQLPDKLQAIAEAGFQAVDIFEDDLIHFQGSIEDIRNLCQRLGLRITMFQTFRDFEGTNNQDAFQKNLERLEKKFQVMDQLQTDLLLMCASCSPNSSGDRTRIVQDLRVAADAAAKRGKRIGYEALAWSQYVNTWQTAWEIVKEVNHPSFGIVLDSFHILSRGSDISGIESIPGNRIFMIQVADAPLLKMNAIDYSRHHRTFPLQGTFPVLAFMKTITRTGYRGPFSLEIFNDEFRAAPAKRVAQDCMRSMIMLQSAMYGDQLLPALPTMIGLDYVEIAVDDTYLFELEEFLSDLGFRKAARHRSKNIQLYQSGSINLMLNSEQESFASSYSILHGPSICATAIKVNSVEATIRRAEFLGYSIVSPKIPNKGEIDVLAIKAPDDTLVYLVDENTAWRSNFISELSLPVKSSEQMASSLVPTYTKVDHITQVLDILSMDQFVLFYKSLFAMTDKSIFHANDPYGAPTARAMISPNKDIRFPLNLSDSPEGARGRSLRGSSGSLVSHVALQTDNIVQTVEQIKRFGQTGHFLKVPSYYYEELPRHHNLPKDFIAKMRACNLMYDRDEHGEYLHTVTDQFQDRFFFEIVQRINGYDEFGSINEPMLKVVQSERKVLNDAIKSRVGSPVPWRMSSTGGLEAIQDRTIIVIYNEGSGELVDLVADVLGKEKVFVCTSNDFVQIRGCPVVGISVQAARTNLRNEILDRDKLHTVTINAIAVDGTGDITQYMSNEVDYEYLYPQRRVSRKDVTRYLTFVLGQSEKHQQVIKKSRSVCLALTFPDVRIALSNLDILTVGADSIEFRADLLKESIGGGKYSDLPSVSYVGEQLMALRQATELPIVFTARTAREGGSFPLDSENECHFLYQKAIQWGCEYIDVEVRQPEEMRVDLAGRKGNTKMTVSYHDHSGELKWTGSEIHRRYHEARRHGDIIKFIGFANTISDNYDLENFRSSVTASYTNPLTAINAGQVGQLSRLFNTFFTTATHSLLPFAGAPGQLSAGEINGALHIVGQLPRKNIYSVGAPRAGPHPQFFEKCFKELGMPHHFSFLERIPDHAMPSFVQQSIFGGAILDPPILGHPNYLQHYTKQALTTGIVDTIFVQSEGNQQKLVGDNAASKGIRSALTRDFAPAAFYNQPVLVVSNTFEEASSAIFALRSLRCGTIYTVGFKIPPSNEAASNTAYCNSHEMVQRLPHPFAMVSAISADQGFVIQPLLRIINSHARPIQGGKIFLDLSNGPKRGDPLGIAAASGWTTYGIADIAAWTTVERLNLLVGQNVPYDFVRMASGRGMF